MRIIILLLGLFVFSQTSRSQDLYLRYLGDSSNGNAAKGMIPLRDGFTLMGYFFYESDSSSTPFDLFFLKINLKGQVIGSRTFRGEKDEALGSIKPMDSTGYILLAASNSYGNGKYDNLILRLNNEGDTVWVKLYGGSKSDFNNRNNNLEILPDGSFIISSMTSSVGQGGFDAHIVRFSSDGDPIWARTIGGSGDERLQDGGMIRVDSSIYIVGKTQSPEFNSIVADGMVIKMDLNGDTLWSMRYSDWGFDDFDNINKAGENNFLLVGQTLSTPTPSKFDGYIVKINSEGDSLWIRGLAAPGHVYLYKSFTTPHGHYIVGRAGDIIFGKYVGFITKISLNGELLWSRFLDDSTGSSIEDLHIDSLGNLFLFGYLGEYETNSFFIKTDTTSSLGQCNFKDAFPNLRSTTTQVFDMHPMVIDTILPISSVTLKVGSGFSVKNYCSGIGFEELSEDEQINLYPNPFSTQLNFNFPESTNQKITIEIIEIATGRIILKEIFNSFNGVLSINDIASGIYLARVSDGKKVLYNGKLVCIKQ